MINLATRASLIRTPVIHAIGPVVIARDGRTTLIGVQGEDEPNYVQKFDVVTGMLTGRRNMTVIAAVALP